MLREKGQNTSNYGFQNPLNSSNQGDATYDMPMFENQRPKSNFKPRSTVGGANGIYGVGGTSGKNVLSQSRGNFNHWNSV